jgi:hypothetical protein
MSFTLILIHIYHAKKKEKKKKHLMHPVGFEPTPPERIELESTALDHSATNAKHM